MAQRLSARESRRLVRRFLSQDARAPRTTVLFAGGAHPAAEPVRAQSRQARAARGPYEVEYVVSDGYATERTIIIP